MTLLTDILFYKVTNVNGNNITVVSATDNKEYTTTTKADIPIMKDYEVITTSSIKVGDYFRCSPFTYNNVTTYAALVISESDYQSMIEFRNKENLPQYTKSVATFYIVDMGGSRFDLACSQNGEKYTTVVADEDTIINVNGVKEKDGGERLQVGQRVLVQYGWENSSRDLANLKAIVVY